MLFGSGAEGASEAWFTIGHVVEISPYVVSGWLVILVLGTLAFVTTRNLKKVPSGIQNFVEFLIEALWDFLEGMLGPDRIKKYFPLLCTFFLFILTSNYIGLLPFSGHGGPYIPPTANINTTAALALIVFFSTHVLGIQAQGIKYFKHFLTPIPFMLPMNIIEEIVRPLSLAMRLYGNVFGHELVVATFIGLAPFLAPLPMQLLGVLTGAIQAFVFTLLSTTYIAAATEKHH